MATLSLLCPACSVPLDATTLAPACACGARIELREGGGFEAGGPVERCAVCGSEAFHIAKDFNKNLGVAVVAERLRRQSHVVGVLIREDWRLLSEGFGENHFPPPLSSFSMRSKSSGGM